MKQKRSVLFDFLLAYLYVYSVFFSCFKSKEEIKRCMNYITYINDVVSLNYKYKYKINCFILTFLATIQKNAFRFAFHVIDFLH